MSPRVKGNVVRAWARCAERCGSLSRVRDRLSKETLAVLENPPLPASWTPSVPIDELFAAVYTLEGHSAALQLARMASRELEPTYTTMLSGLLRLLGTSPASLFRRLDSMVKQAMEGVDYRWIQTADCAGTLEVHYPVGSRVSACSFVSMIPTLEIIFRLCRVKGTISDPIVTSESSALFRLSW